MKADNILHTIGNTPHLREEGMLAAIAQKLPELAANAVEGSLPT
jgi:hypothetical protein